MRAASITKRKSTTPAPPAADIPAWGVGAEIARRALLGLAAALVVARPLVLGEDPGLLLQSYSDATSLVLVFLWLALSAGWALWRARTGLRA